jgi:hypothetical protein
MTEDLLADAHALESPAKKQALSSNASNKENAGPVGRTPSKREPASTPAKVLLVCQAVSAELRNACNKENAFSLLQGPVGRRLSKRESLLARRPRY